MLSYRMMADAPLAIVFSAATYQPPVFGPTLDLSCIEEEMG